MRSLLSGIVLVLCGLSGEFVLRGTGSSGALVVAGLVVCVIGIAKMASNGDGYRATPTEEDVERDNEQWAEYQRAKQTRFKKDVLQQLIDVTPGADATVQELMERTKGHLSSEEQLELALETAKRLNAEQQVAA